MQHGAGALIRLAPGDGAPAVPRHGAEKEVFTNRELAGERYVLIHGGKPECAGALGREVVDRLALDLDFAGIEAVGRTIRILMSVDLPEPFSPTSACTSPD